MCCGRAASVLHTRCIGVAYVLIGVASVLHRCCVGAPSVLKKGCAEGHRPFAGGVGVPLTYLIFFFGKSVA